MSAELKDKLFVETKAVTEHLVFMREHKDEFGLNNDGVLSFGQFVIGELKQYKPFGVVRTK